MAKVIIDTDPNSEKDPIEFHCWRCGACCMSISGIEGYEELDDGTGTCIHFDRKSRNCLIYENRPLMCNVWGLYDAFYKDDLTREEYALLNIESCRGLRAGLGLPEPELLIARKKAREAEQSGKKNPYLKQAKVPENEPKPEKEPAEAPTAEEQPTESEPAKPKKKSWLGL